MTTAAGFCGHAKMFDYQAGMEKSLGVLSSIMTGSHLHTLQGSFAGELGYSNILQVLDEEIAGSIGRYLLGTRDRRRDAGGRRSARDAERPRRASWAGRSRASTGSRTATSRSSPTGARTSTGCAAARRTSSRARGRRSTRSSPSTARRRSRPSRARPSRTCSAEAREYYRGNGLIGEEEWAPYTAALEAADLP